MVALTWRERRRAEAVAEIKDVARRLLVAGGPTAVSLRAISREMGMTTSALYRYYPSLDALVAALRVDLFEEVGGVTQAARGEAGGDDPIPRVAAMARAFRRWGLAHRQEFGLMLGPPVHGLGEADEPAERDSAAACLGVAFLEEFAELWRRGELRAPRADVAQGHRLVPSLGDYVAGSDGIELPVVFAFLSAWTRLYGIIAMEIFGHMDWAVSDPEAFFEMELTEFVRQLGGDDQAVR
ncbi:TetR/AcrR family transcriptional regulator [Spirillospora sp. NPDC047418]